MSTQNSKEYAREELENRVKLAKEKKTVSEININIKMEGGTKVERKETKKEAPGKESASGVLDQKIYAAGNQQ